MIPKKNCQLWIVALLSTFRYELHNLWLVGILWNIAIKSMLYHQIYSGVKKWLQFLSYFFFRASSDARSSRKSSTGPVVKTSSALFSGELCSIFSIQIFIQEIVYILFASNNRVLSANQIQLQSEWLLCAARNYNPYIYIYMYIPNLRANSVFFCFSTYRYCNFRH